LNKFMIYSDLSKFKIWKIQIVNKFEIKPYSKIEQIYNLHKLKI
jgi:hypothetical protein